MKTVSFEKPQHFKEISLVLILGLIIGILTTSFVKLLFAIEQYQVALNRDVPMHLALIPLVLFVFIQVKKRSLFFPVKVVQLVEEKSSVYWSGLMSVFHFFGTMLSHLSGVSVGREGAVVLYSAGLVRSFKLNWKFWGPIASAIGFATVIGNYWVAPIFGLEFFGKTTTSQKVYSLMGATLAVLIMQSFGVPHLVKPLEDVVLLSVEFGFFQKLFLLFFTGVFAGYLMRIYKFLHEILVKYFLQSVWGVKAVGVLILMVFLSIPEFRKFQSLGVMQIVDLASMNANFADVVCKLAFTMLSASLGFWGGEFVPLVYAGLHFGFSFFQFFGLSPLVGATLAAYLFFAGGTRMKWTSYFLVLSVMGWSWWFWAYFTVMTTVSFSGERSLYKAN